jgi:fatty-acyl-CoA synthase
MVSLTYAEAARFDPRAFHEFAAAQLAPYAVPLFVRITAEADLTTTFKLRKVELQRAGYDPRRCHDPLFVRDASAQRYVPLTAQVLAALGIAAFMGD